MPYPGGYPACLPGTRQAPAPLPKAPLGQHFSRSLLHFLWDGSSKRLNSAKTWFKNVSTAENCCGGRRSSLSARYATSFLPWFPKMIESLEIDSFSQILFSVDTVIPATPRSMSDTFLVPDINVDFLFIAHCRASNIIWHYAISLSNSMVDINPIMLL